ncbi:MAG: alanine/ornithine racemase family PLP-dependent enzyme [Lachnospiraceae bacterium]|jgi:predicted amino acid racemase|nr:alanine/ornithine racemase family PLP-dependent enzyme [Lachnospiraceae bacterium]
MPRLTIDLGIIRSNVRAVRDLCAGHGIGITGVTKVFCGDPVVAKAFLDAGVTRLGDSRVANLRRLQFLDGEKWLIRMPAPSEIPDVVRYADVSLNSEWHTLSLLSEEALRQGKRHKVILMADLGDLREGYVDYGELRRVAQMVVRADGLELYGIGTNLSCFSFIHPDTGKMRQLLGLAGLGNETLSAAADVPMSPVAFVISGGNSASLHLMMENGIPPGVNNLRLGESLLFGKERCHYTYLPGTRRDAFILSAEVIELKEKPSVPWGEAGVDSYGNPPPVREDKGVRSRAILALGKQDCDVETMRPVDGAVAILGASSDHMVLDVTDSARRYALGDTVEFELGYFALMRAYTSGYVEKVYVG